LRHFPSIAVIVRHLLSISVIVRQFRHLLSIFV
jgi:hypothetical protein